MINLRTRKPRILIDPPYIPPELDRKLVGTRVQFSSSTDFEDASSMVCDKTVYLPEDILNIDITKPNGDLLEISLDDVYYFRYQLIYDSVSNPTNDPNRYIKDSFSVISSIYGDQEGFRFDHIIITTPYVQVEEKTGSIFNQSLKFTASGFKVIVGTGKHQSTTWMVETSDGEMIYKREKDEDNKESLELPMGLFQPGKLYIIKARFITDTNGESNFGTFYYNSAIARNDYLTVEPINELLYGNDLYFKVTTMLPNVTGINAKLYTVSGERELEVPATIKVENSKIKITAFTDVNGKYNKVPSIPITNIYRLYLYPVVNNNTNAYYTTGIMKEFVLKFPEVYPIHPDSNYPGKYTLLNDLNLGGVVIGSKELKNGTIVLVDNSYNKIKLYSRYGQSIRPTNVEFDLPVTEEHTKVPFLHVYELYNGQVAINYGLFKDEEYKQSIWGVYSTDYNLNKWTLVKTIKETDVSYSTSVSSSGVVLKDNSILFIPAMINRGETELSLKRVDFSKSNNNITTVQIDAKDVIEEGITQHMSLVPITTDLTSSAQDLLIIGGTDSTRIEAIPGQKGVYYYNLKNRKLRILSISLSQPGNVLNLNARYVMDPIKSLPLELPDNLFPDTLYNLSAFRRSDGKIVIFNNSTNGTSSTDSSSFILDLTKVKEDGIEDGWIIKESNDTRIDLPFRSTIAMNNGDFIRLSYMETLDGDGSRITKVLLYPHQPLTDYSDTDEPVIINKHLVVPVGKTMSIENPYLYDSILIEGDSPGNTGILLWTDVNKQRIFDYSWTIITRNTTVTSEEDRAQNKEKLFVLDGVQYTVRDK